MPEVTTPAEEAQSAARSARRRAERQSIRDEVMVAPEPTLPAHVYAMQREVEIARSEGETQVIDEPVAEPTPEPAPEAPKATRSRKAAAK